MDKRTCIENIDKSIENLKQTKEILKFVPESDFLFSPVPSSNGYIVFNAFYIHMDATNELLESCGWEKFGRLNFYSRYGTYLQDWRHPALPYEGEHLSIIYRDDGLVCKRTKIGVEEVPVYELSCGADFSE